MTFTASCMEKNYMYAQNVENFGEEVFEVCDANLRIQERVVSGIHNGVVACRFSFWLYVTFFATPAPSSSSIWLYTLRSPNNSTLARLLFCFPITDRSTLTSSQIFALYPVYYIEIPHMANTNYENQSHDGKKLVGRYVPTRRGSNAKRNSSLDRF